MLDSTADTGAVTRVLIDSTDGDDTWTTIGVSANVIEASWMALIDAFVFGLTRTNKCRVGRRRSRAPTELDPVT